MVMFAQWHRQDHILFKKNWLNFLPAVSLNKKLRWKTQFQSNGNFFLFVWGWCWIQICFCEGFLNQKIFGSREKIINISCFAVVWDGWIYIFGKVPSEFFLQRGLCLVLSFWRFGFTALV